MIALDKIIVIMMEEHNVIFLAGDDTLVYFVLHRFAIRVPICNLFPRFVIPAPICNPFVPFCNL